MKYLRQISLGCLFLIAVALVIFFTSSSSNVLKAKLIWFFKYKHKFLDHNKNALFDIHIEKYNNNKIAITISGKCYNLSILTQFNNIGRLYIKDCPIVNLVSLEGLKTDELYIGDGTELTSLQGVEKMGIKYLYIFNPILLEDISMLKTSNIEYLHMPGAKKLKEITSLGNIKTLRYLHIPYSDIDDISPLSNNEKLTIIDIPYTKVKSIKPLQNLPLERLAIKGTPAEHEEIPLILKDAISEGYKVKF